MTLYVARFHKYAPLIRDLCSSSRCKRGPGRLSISINHGVMSILEEEGILHILGNCTIIIYVYLIELIVNE